MSEQFETVEVDAAGVMLDDGGAVEVGLVPGGERVSIKVIEPDGKATLLVLSREAMDAIGELYVSEVDAEEAKTAGLQ
jgi:hypothetical protein